MTHPCFDRVTSLIMLMLWRIHTRWLGLQDWKKKLVGVGCDGASTNLGIRNGVVVKLQAAGVPWLVGIHCFCHRLEHAMKDAMANTYFDTVCLPVLFKIIRSYHYIKI